MTATNPGPLQETSPIFVGMPKFPQAARTAVPPLSNTLIDLVKSTSLASSILVVELLRQAQIAAAPTCKFFTLYGLAAIYYWLISVALSFAQARIEKRVSRFVA